MRKLRVLVGCEFSGVVRRAFRALGHDAWSCDLLPAEDKSDYHHECDIFNCLRHDDKYDLFIFHWPCTRLCNSGVRWLYGGGGDRIDAVRWMAMEEDARNFHRLLNWPIKHVAGENPIPHRYAKKYMGDYSQTLQPYEHGHGETKRTCLWLRNLPVITPTNIVDGRHARVHLASPGPDRWKERSRTYPGIAKALATQWSEYILNL